MLHDDWLNQLKLLIFKVEMEHTSVMALAEKSLQFIN